MSKTQVFIFSWISFLVWVFINNFFWNNALTFIVLLFLVILFLLLYIFTKKYAFVVCLSIVTMILWVLYSFYNISNIHRNLKLVNTFQEKVDIESEILGLKLKNETHTIYDAKIYKIWNKNIDANIYAQIHIQSNFQLKKWTKLKTKAKIYTYKNSSHFKYKYFMLSSFNYFKIYPYNYEIVWKSDIHFIETSIINLRETFLQIIQKLYPEQEAIFLWWILFWAREAIPKELKTNFNNSWLTHFIAVSGFNITILIVFFSVFIKYLPSFLRVISILVAISIFTLLVGPSVAVIRASIMWFVWYLAITMWRKKDNLAVVIFTLICMVIYAPLSLNYDVSLHLSFLAVLWIIYFQEYITKIFSFVTDILEIRTAIVLTLSALILTFPIMIFSFGQISVLVVVTNILVSWTIPFAMLFWFLSIMMHFLWEFWAVIIWFFAFLLLKWDIWVVNFFGSKSWSVLKVDLWEYSWYFQVIYLISMVFIILWFRTKEKEEK